MTASGVGVPLPFGVVAVIVLFMVAPSIDATCTSITLVTATEQSLLPSVEASGNVFKPQEIEPAVAVTACSSAGTTIFAPFKEDTSYFGDRRFQWMINFRVRDLNKMVAQLRERGITVELDSEVYPNGRFARLSDPEGNPIQLWQPGGKDPG